MNNAEYMTVGETIAKDIGCVLENLWTAAECIVAFLVCAFGTVAAIVGSIIYVFLEVDMERECTQWFYGTGKYANRN